MGLFFHRNLLITIPDFSLRIRICFEFHVKKCVQDRLRLARMRQHFFRNFFELRKVPACIPTEILLVPTSIAGRLNIFLPWKASKPSILGELMRKLLKAIAGFKEMRFMLLKWLFDLWCLKKGLRVIQNAEQVVKWLANPKNFCHYLPNLLQASSQLVRCSATRLPEFSCVVRAVDSSKTREQLLKWSYGSLKWLTGGCNRASSEESHFKINLKRLKRKKLSS